MGKAPRRSAIGFGSKSFGSHAKPSLRRKAAPAIGVALEDRPPAPGAQSKPANPAVTPLLAPILAKDPGKKPKKTKTVAPETASKTKKPGKNDPKPGGKGAGKKSKIEKLTPQKFVAPKASKKKTPLIAVVASQDKARGKDVANLASNRPTAIEPKAIQPKAVRVKASQVKASQAKLAQTQTPTKSNAQAVATAKSPARPAIAAKPSRAIAMETAKVVQRGQLRLIVSPEEPAGKAPKSAISGASSAKAKASGKAERLAPPAKIVAPAALREHDVPKPQIVAAAPTKEVDVKPAKPSAPAHPPQLPPGILDLLRKLDATTSIEISRNLAEVYKKLTQAGLLSTAPDGPRGIIFDRPDPFGAGPAITEAANAFWRAPETAFPAQMELWRGLTNVWGNFLGRLAGQTPEPTKDKRFKDPEWTQNPAYEMLMRTYLTLSDWCVKQVEAAPGLSVQERRKATFFARATTDAFAPTNFAAMNPQVIRETIETGGKNLVQGIDNYVHDVKRGKGRLQISQTDLTAFEIGRNIATTPGKVVFRNRLIELIQYEATTDEVYAVPLLIFPPWINKFYIMDLKSENSMIRWLTDQGFTVFVVSWANPDQAKADIGFEDYALEGVFPALDIVQKITGEKQVNLVGYCIGGTMLSSTLAYMGQTGDKRANSATFFAAQTEFSDAGDLLVFTDDQAFDYLNMLMDRGAGILEGQHMAATFNLLRGNDLIWRYWIDNYMMGKSPPAFDLLYWNADQTRMTKRAHTFYLDNFYRHNKLARGEMTFLGKNIRLSDVKIPVFFQAGREDHIAPYASIYRGAKLFGGPVQFLLAGSGHIAGVINHPAAKKYQHWIYDAMQDVKAGALPATADAWALGAKEHPGSWWPHWSKWLAGRSGKKVKARKPGGNNVKPICDAPGEYVKVRS